MEMELQGVEHVVGLTVASSTEGDDSGSHGRGPKRTRHKWCRQGFCGVDLRRMPAV
uniref:Uncharacterized protein n=1 Tax=Oryza meridionalis TaxID=40149 RepID=A0A0E0CAF5_9ORYZ